MAQIDKLRNVLEAKGFRKYENDILEYELSSAAETINRIRGIELTALPENMDVEEKYANLQIDMAIESIAKYGVEGQKSHSENGISRGYENGGKYSTESLNKIIPLVGIGNKTVVSGE